MSKGQPIPLLFPAPTTPAIAADLESRGQLATELLASRIASGVGATGSAVEQGEGGREQLRGQIQQPLEAHRHAAKCWLGSEGPFERSLEVGPGALGRVGETAQTSHQLR